MPKTHKQNIIYQLFRCYLRLIHDRLFYKRVHRIGLENVPEEGKPLLIVSNHQNCLNDPLGLIFTFRDRKPHILARADVIEHNKFTNKFLRSVGLLPTFRMNYDGADAVSKNTGTFNESEDALGDGNTIILFPEGMHQDKRWLGEFSSGFTKMAFETAEKSDFETEVFIQPACNHYSDYYGIRNEMIIKFGTPISIAPFYELYKTKPRTAQRQVIALAHEQIGNLMLNITDLDNYEAIDFIRNIYGRRYALAQGLNPMHFPNMLDSDKRLFANLEKAKAENLDNVIGIYNKALEYKKTLESLNVTNNEVACNANLAQITANVLSLIVLLPIWIVSLWPNIFIYNASNLFMKNVKDKMFEGTFRYTVSVMGTIPIFYILTFAVACSLANIWIAICYLCLLPALAVFAWNYWCFFKRTLKLIRFDRLKPTERKNLTDARKSVISSLDEILR